MFGPAVSLLRSTGADLPWGSPEAGHPGVALESWFWRLVAPDASRAVLCALTVVREPDGQRWAGATLATVGPDGRAAVREGILAPATVATDRLSLNAGARGAEPALARAVADASGGSLVRGRCQAPSPHATGGFARADADGLEVELGEDAWISLTLGRPWRWPRRALGGLGLGHVVPALSQYWHPWLLGAAEVRGHARIGHHDVALDGMRAYGEKNWGRAGTPRAWWWGQAAPEPEVAVAFAGGVLDVVGPVRAGATAVAVRLGDALASFSPGLGLTGAQVGAGGWRVQGRELVGRAGWRVELEASTATPPLDLLVPVPGERRMAPLSHQHQDGDLTLTVRRGRRLAYRGTAQMAGLERGGHELHRATG